jgi:NADPH-dependent 2,4-dienoyl-CoA reductase/sulfur reductase-like enzyme
MKVVVVGGVAGGGSCAARRRRLDEKAEIIMVERDHAISSNHILAIDTGMKWNT